MSSILYNPPGLDQLNYRVGDYQSFQRTMLSEIHRVTVPGQTTPPLFSLNIDDPAAWTVALVDAWATVGDILTFYQERLINEGYLGTATQATSLNLLLGSLGFSLPRGTTPKSHVAYTVAARTAGTQTAARQLAGLPRGGGAATARGQARADRRAAASLVRGIEKLGALGPSTVTTIPSQSLVQSIASQGRTVQTFETDEELAAKSGWNQLKPRVHTVTRTPRLGARTTEVRLAGTATQLAVGQPLLIVGRVGVEERRFVRTIRQLTPYRKDGDTLVVWDRPLGANCELKPGDEVRSAKVFGFAQQVALFGSNAPLWNKQSVATKREYAPIRGGVLSWGGQLGVWSSRNHGLPVDDVTAVVALAGGQILAGTSSQGVYRWTGNEWQASGSGLNRQSVRALSAGPDGEVLAGTVGGGVFRSADGGKSWDPVKGGPPKITGHSGSSPSPSRSGLKIQSSSLPSMVVRALWAENSMIYAGGDSFVYRFVDGAWGAMHNENQDGQLVVYDFAEYMGSLYAASQAGVLRLDQKKQTWVFANDGLPKGTRVSALVAPCAGAGPLFAATELGVYRWNEDTWGALTLKYPVRALSATCAAQGSLELVFAGTEARGVYFSSDLGDHWRPVPSATRTPGIVPPRHVQALAATEDALWAAAPFDGFAARQWPGFEIRGRGVDLAKTVKEVAAPGWLVLAEGAGSDSASHSASGSVRPGHVSSSSRPPTALALAYRVDDVTTVYRQDFTLAARVTQLEVGESTGLGGFDLRTASAWVGSAELSPFVETVPQLTLVRGRTIELATQLDEVLPTGRRMVVLGQPVRAAITPPGGVFGVRTPDWSDWRRLALVQSDVRALALNSKGDLYVGTHQDGVYLLRQGSEPRLIAEGLEGLEVSSLVAAPADSRWQVFAGTDSGVFALEGTGSQRFTRLGGDTLGAVLSLALGGTSLFAGTTTGLVETLDLARADASWETLAGLGRPVASLLFVAPDTLWAGTRGKGAFHLVGGRSVPVRLGLQNLDVTSLLLDDDQRLWAGTLGGVYRLDREGDRWLPESQGLTHRSVNALVVDDDGLLVAGTRGGGVVRQLRAGASAVWQSTASGLSNDVRALAAGSGEVFAGARDVSLVTTDEGRRVLEIALLLRTSLPAEPDIESMLDQGNLPASLVEALSAKGVHLGDGATVVVMTWGRLWRVVDTDAVYYVIRRQDSIQVYANPATFRVVSSPRDQNGERVWTLADDLGTTGTLASRDDELILLPATQGETAQSEVVELAGQTPDPAASDAKTLDADDSRNTVLRLEKSLTGVYDAASTKILANVVPVSHGRRFNEVLGDGDASRANQSFPLSQGPVALVPSEGTMTMPALQVQVDGVPWSYVASLVSSGPDDLVYTAKFDAKGSATVIFGDGLRGARPSSGSRNITAQYRVGDPRDGELGVGRIRQHFGELQVAAVNNPVPSQSEIPGSATVALRSSVGTPQRRSAGAISRSPGAALDLTGDAWAESRGGLVPPVVRTLGRIVSPLDFDDFLLSQPTVSKALTRLLWSSGGPLVNITIAGKNGQEIKPSSGVLSDLLAAVEGARAPGSPVRLLSFRPASFNLDLRVQPGPSVTAAAAEKELLEEVEKALAAAFGPVARELGVGVSASEIVSVVQGIDDVEGAKVDALYRSSASPGLNTVLPAQRPPRNLRQSSGLADELLVINAKDGLRVRSVGTS